MSDVQSAELRTRRHRIVSGAILVVGLSIALVIYLRATSAQGNPLGYDPDDSKQYLRQMEVYGGTANVLASQVREFFGSLWHGTRLAGTVAFMAALLAGGVWFFGTRLPAEEEVIGEDDGGNGRRGRA